MSTTNETNEAAEMSAIVLKQAERLFRGEITKERLEAAEGGAWPAELWAAVEENGLPLAMVPEAAGGVGLPATDALKLLRLSGYHTLPLPLAETMVGAALWAEASGEAVAGALAIGPSAPGEQLQIAKSGADWTLAGTLTRIPWGAQAAHALLHARDASGAGYLVLLPRGAGRTEPRANIGREPRDTLVLDGVSVPAAAVRPAPAACREGMLAVGALVRTQQMTGAMERALDYALAYVMERKQFGRELAKFQAIQQQLAEAAGLFAISAAAADGAREAWGRPGFEMSVALAKARVGEAVNRLTDVCHQVHGAMGYTQELPLHFATRRLWAWREEFGNETHWQRRIGEWACANGGEALWHALAENRFE